MFDDSSYDHPAGSAQSAQVPPPAENFNGDEVDVPGPCKPWL
jgi:hypothetical protein